MATRECAAGDFSDGESQASGKAATRRSPSRSQQPRPAPRDDDDERVVALNALLQMDSDRALPLLKRVLERRDECSYVLRRKAVFLVSQKGGDEAADILMQTARNDPDRETREQAVFWLGQVRDRIAR